MDCCFFNITPIFTLILLPTSIFSFLSKRSSPNLILFAAIPFSHNLSLSLFSVSAFTHFFFHLLSAFPIDRAFHYSAASIDLLSGWRAIDYNTCSSATELSHNHCAKSYTHTLISPHQSCKRTLVWTRRLHISLHPSHIHFKTLGNTQFPLFYLLISIATLLLGIHQHINFIYISKHIRLHVQVFNCCFGTGPSKDCEIERLDTDLDTSG